MKSRLKKIYTILIGGMVLSSKGYISHAVQSEASTKIATVQEESANNAMPLTQQVASLQDQMQELKQREEMRIGGLTFSAKNIDLFNLDLLSVVNHLMNVEQIKFERAQNNRDYWDAILSTYRNAKEELAPEDLKDVMTIFYKKIQECFEKEKNRPYLEELQATPLDFALLKNDRESIERLTRELSEGRPFPNIYSLAKSYRFMELSQDMYGSECQAGLVTIRSMSETIPLTSIAQLCGLERNRPTAKTAVILVTGGGDKTWDYNMKLKEYQLIRPLFDIVITAGNGVTDLNHEGMDRLAHLVQTVKNKDLSKGHQLDFALVYILKHGKKGFSVCHPKDIIDEVKKLDFGRAKEAVYLLNSCYSGQYHEVWDPRDLGRSKNKNISLITTSSKDECSLVSGFSPEAFATFFAASSDRNSKNELNVNNKLNTENLVAFYATKYKHSVPHFSGYYKGNYYKRKPVSQLCSRVRRQTM